MLKSRVIILWFLCIVACLLVGCFGIDVESESKDENVFRKGIAGIQKETEGETEDDGLEQISWEEAESLPILPQGETIYGDAETNYYSIVVNRAVLYDNLMEAGISAEQIDCDATGVYFPEHEIVAYGEDVWQEDGSLVGGVQFLVLNITVTYLNDIFGDGDRLNLSAINLHDKYEIDVVTDAELIQAGVVYNSVGHAINLAYVENPYSEEQSLSIRACVGESVETKIGFFVPEGNEDLVGVLVNGHVREGVNFFSWEPEEVD